MSAAPPEDFSDRRAVEAWLRTQLWDINVALAARAVLRALPVHAIRSGSEVNSDHALVWFMCASAAALAAHRVLLSEEKISDVSAISVFFSGEAAMFEDAASSAASAVCFEETAHHCAEAIALSLTAADMKGAFLEGDPFRSDCL